VSQLYARVFLQILDSSIANDWATRHVFEDFLKLANAEGVVDMTREAVARRTNASLDVINKAINTLEAPDANSRDPEDDGRRLIRLDDHRDWGWEIVNWHKYEAIKSKLDQMARDRDRMAKRRARDRHPSPHTPLPQTQPQTQTQRACDKSEQKRTRANTNEQRRTDTNNSPEPERDDPLREVELPPRFPATLEVAITNGACIGAMPEFIEEEWNLAMARGGRDPKDVPIRNWPNYLALRLKYARRSQANNAHANANGDHTRPSWQATKELEAVEKELALIKGRASHTATGFVIEQADKASWKALKARQKALKVEVGLRTEGTP
jgi:hypothetical protein